MQPRVLLLEDIASTRKAYRRVLELNNLNVSEAASLKEAVTILERIAFHVVCLDLCLDESDPSNHEGKMVLQEISKYGEGTKAIIVSYHRGERAHDIAIEAYESFGLARWLRKGQFSPEEFASIVVETARSVRFRVFDKAASALEALTEDFDSQVWMDHALRLLKPRGGVVGLRDILSNLTQELIPIRPHKDPTLRAIVDADTHLVSFRFWSRAIGSAVTIEVHSHSADSYGAETDQPDRRVIKRASMSGLIAYALADVSDNPFDYL